MGYSSYIRQAKTASHQRKRTNMSMRSSTSPRRIYVRGGIPLVCYSGVYFGKKSASEIDPAKEVKIEVLEASHGKKRIAVTQRKGKNTVTENWTEQSLTFAKRGAKAEEAVEA